MKDLRSLNLTDMILLAESFQEPKYRANQLFDWVHNKQVTAIGEMSNINKTFLQHLTDNDYGIYHPSCEKHQVSRDGTEKFLLKLVDGNYIETVLMKYRGDYSKQRNTLCVSSQVGCKMGCAFCATGDNGFTRDLTVEEIISQIYFANQSLKECDEPMGVRNIVFMGMGEPFDNYDNLMRAISILRHKQGADISSRRITISTCGVVPTLIQFANDDTDIGLAVSLHAATNEKRNAIMPINKKFPLEKLMEACRYYKEKTGKRISFEYALIEGVNDSAEDISDLRKLLSKLDCHVNIIPVNNVMHADKYSKPSLKNIRSFVQALNKVGVKSSIRQEKGGDIDAACGQLKANHPNL